MIDDSYERIRRPAEGRGLGPVSSLILKTRLLWGEVALGHDADVHGPISEDVVVAIKDVQVGNLLLEYGLQLRPEEVNDYQQAQELINTTRPMGMRISPSKIHQPPVETR